MIKLGRALIWAVAAALMMIPANAQTGITPCAAFTISASVTTANQQLSACNGTTIIWNIGAQEAFYNFGTGSGTAATTSNFSIPGTSFIVLNLGTNRPYLAAITASSSTTIRITQGFLR